MKTFESKFPELMKGSMMVTDFGKNRTFIPTNEIEQHCLSRSRVKKVIEEIGGTQDLMEARENALKEFGL